MGTRPSKFAPDDSKSVISKASSRNSSKPKLAPTSSGPIVLSREEDQRIAKEKKERLDNIKK